MILFERSPIFLDEETVAEQLRRTRQAKEVSLEEAAKALNIKAEYLDALEKNQYHRLPKGVYGKTFLREYCDFLGLDYRELVKKFEAGAGGRTAQTNDVFERRVVSKRQLITLPLLIRNAIIGALIIGCLTWLGLLLKGMFDPPFLEVTYPAENIVTAESAVTIRGRSEPESAVTINGQPVLLDGSGGFEREIFLQSGLNEIVVTAGKKYSRTVTLLRQILVE